MKQIICLGDGGLDGNNPLMDLYILAQTNKRNPKICFLPTASGDAEGYCKYFKHVFSKYPCIPEVLTLFRPHTADIKGFLMSMDAIFVGGGQSKSMIAVWRGWEVDQILDEANQNGTILSGGSAGSVCWFDQCITDSIPGSLTVMNCTGILPYSNCPHFSSRSRRASYAKFVASGEIKGGYANDDYAALHFVDGELFRSVSNRPYAKTWKVDMENGKFSMNRLKTDWLGMKENQQKYVFGTPMFNRYKDVEHEKETSRTSIVKVESKRAEDVAS